MNGALLFVGFVALVMNAIASSQDEVHKALPYIGLSQVLHQVVTLTLLIHFYIEGVME